MGVPTDVKVRFLVFEKAFHLGHVMVGIAPDVGHVDIHILDMEKQVLGILHAHDMVVDVAVDGAQRFEGSQGLCGFDVANVACMPQLINVLEEAENLRYERAMGVRQDADFQHVTSS